MFLTSSLFDSSSDLLHAFSQKITGSDFVPLAQFLKTSPQKIVVLKQTHSAGGIIITKVLKKTSIQNFSSPFFKVLSTPPQAYDLEGDALITNEPNVVIGVRTADCIPLLVYDPIQKVVAAIHAGWKGFLLGVIENTIHTMQDFFHSDPATLQVAIGVTLCQTCFEVGPEVLDQFKEKFGTSLFYKSGKIEKFHIDLKAQAISHLVSLGLSSKNIEALKGCTSCDHDQFFSFRKGDVEGRQLSVIGLKI